MIFFVCILYRRLQIHTNNKMVDVGDARSESKLRNSCSEYLTAEVQKVLACCVARLKKNAATTFHYNKLASGPR